MRHLPRQRQGHRARIASSSSRVRHACGIAGRLQRDRSRGITRLLRCTEQLWAGAADSGGASTAYLPAPAAVALAAILAAFSTVHLC